MLIGLGLKLSFASIFHFPVPHACSPFPVPRSPFPVPRSPFPVLRSPFPVPRSPFPVPRSPFPITRFLGLFPLLVNNTRHDDIFFPRKALTRQIYLACSTEVGIQIVGSVQRGVSRFVPPSTHLNVWNRLSDTRRK